MKRLISTALILLISSLFVLLGFKKLRPSVQKPSSKLFV